MINNNKANQDWGENVIIADADYVDSVAFNLIVNFERMIGRHIPQADMAQWVECIALDGGIPTPEMGDDGKVKDSGMTTSVVLIHNGNNSEMNNFNPSSFTTDLDGKAFSGDYGEFVFSAVSADDKSETMTKNDIISDVVAAMADEPKVKRVMIIPNLEKETTMEYLLPVLRHLDRACQEKRITLFAMQPLTGLPCRSEILGYSLMAALGIKASEIK